MRAFLFDTKVAVKIGVEAAVVLQNMDYVVDWSYTQDCILWANFEDLHNLFPFFTKQKLQKLLEILVENDYVEKELVDWVEEQPAFVYRITDKGYSELGYNLEVN